ncbi:MAG: calcium/sodium antiporter [Pseudomonadota bacterium]
MQWKKDAGTDPPVALGVMLAPSLLLLVGLVILLFAGDRLVRGAANLAKIANIPPLIVGLTVVAFGTSAPELVVTIGAVLGDAAGIAMGNIVGSNIANILMVLGLPAIIFPIATTVPRLHLHGGALLLATLLFCGMVYRSGSIGTMEAVIFTIGMLIYFGLMVVESRGGSGAASEVDDVTAPDPHLLPTLGLLAMGLIGLPIGATLLVDNGEHLAKMLGVREEVIGLTVVAFGTSLPELATVLAAALKKQESVAVGSIVGSNVFNMLFVGAAAGYAGTAPFSAAALKVDIPVMIAATVFVSLLIFTKTTYGRTLGMLSVAAYLAYIIILGTAAS